MSYAHRCLDCRRRKALKQPHHWYIRVPKCSCGAQHWTIDWHRQHKKDRATPCGCDGYVFPHRPGGGQYCVEHTHHVPPEVHAAYLRGGQYDFFIR